MPVANAHYFDPRHYNAIAKDIREMYAEAEPQNDEQQRIGDYYFAVRRALEELALKFAKRFAVDSDEFDPLLFLERCSPNNELYPISELWDA